MAGSTRLPIKLALGLAAVSLVGCGSFIKRDEFEATLSHLRSTDQDLQRQINALSESMDQRLSEFDARITQTPGRIRVDTSTHFGFDDATLRDQDRPVLDEFAAVMRDHDSGALITVEGFTDSAGSAAYNQRLGQRRADAVREYLVAQAGMNAAQVRAVSYGKDENRQVRPGAWGEDGLANRRVALVVDYIENDRTTSTASR